MKKKKISEKIKIKPSYKHRVPHKPTRVHRDRTKYTRKGRVAERIRKKIKNQVD